jgi:putative protease
MKAPLDMIIYAKQKLMTMKYCPLKKLGLCGKCKDNKYYLRDKFGKFIINPKDGCYVEIYNELPLNLIEEITKLSSYIDRFRFDFLDESYEEVINILTNAKDILNKKSDQFKLPKQTKGHFKRSILRKRYFPLWR